MNYELHPLCKLFPRLLGEEFDALRDDIKANGLRESIVLYDGMILDGGNRYRACQDAGVDPKFTEFAGDSLVKFVISVNMRHRHMSPGQRAAIVAGAQNWGQAHGRGGDRRSDQSQAVDFETVEQRAAAAGVSRVTQMKADKVFKVDPALAQKVLLAEVSLPQAVKQIAPKRAEPKAAQHQETTKEEPEPAQPHEELKKDEPKCNEPDVATLRQEFAGGLSEIDELRLSLKAATDEIARMKPVFDADDRLAAAQKQVADEQDKVLRLEQRMQSVLNDNNELKREVKSLKRKLAAVEAP